jgi:ComF family protein
MKRVLAYLTALLFPPICRHCGKRQSIFAPRLPQPLCPDCLDAWAGCMQKKCPECGQALPLCPCMPQALKEAACTDLVKLVDYRASKRGVGEKILLRCKDVRDRALFDFLAADLTLPTFRALQSLGAYEGQTVVTFVPRRKSAVRRTGHDQAKELARALARRLSLPCEHLICRKGSGIAQKELNAEERVQRAKHSFALRKRADLHGKTILLLDDICTTGASLARCTELLTDAGAARVIAVCVARSNQNETRSEES